MTRHQARELAYRIIVTHLPASWIEVYDRRTGQGRMTLRAVRLRNRIADELLQASRGKP